MVRGWFENRVLRGRVSPLTPRSRVGLMGLIVNVVAAAGGSRYRIMCDRPRTELLLQLEPPS